MSNWSRLTSAALLGTRRAEAPALQTDPGLEPLAAQLAALPEGDAAARLLLVAGALDLYEQIGRAPARGPSPHISDPAPFELPLPPPRAAEYLAQLLEAPRRSLLPEFLTALAANGQRIPSELLPNLLAAGAAKGSLRPLILPVLGERGAWLAGRNPEWAYAAAGRASWPALRRAWDSATPGAQAALLEQLRATDPARGRALFENVWRTEKDPTRLRLLKLLETGLSMDDEPLLEAALDDRSHLVRREAARLLAALPGSRLGHRMASYVAAYLAWTPGGKQAITVSLPEVSPAMRRDGIVGAASKEVARVRSQEIIQLITGVPLAWWSANWAPPRTLVRAFGDTLWPRTLTMGFIGAAVCQGDAEWAGILLEELGLNTQTARLLPILPNSGFRSLVIGALHENDEDDALDRHGPLLALLRRWSRSWPPDLAAAITAVFAARFAATAERSSPHPLLRSTLLQLALKFPPQTAAEAGAALAPVLQSDGPWRATAAEFIHTLAFRGRMLEALSGAAPPEDAPPNGR